MILLRNVPGLDEDDICSAIVERATPTLDELLQTIGKHGAVTLVGTARASRDTVAVVRMEEVASINGQTLAEIEEEGQEAGPTPVTAAELVRRCNTGLERYERTGSTATTIEGRLKDVHTGDDSLMMTVNHVEGMEAEAFCLAVLRCPTESDETKLQQIGKGGRITLTGQASSDQGSLTAVHMHEVKTINGAQTGQAPEPCTAEQRTSGESDMTASRPEDRHEDEGPPGSGESAERPRGENQPDSTDQAQETQETPDGGTRDINEPAALRRSLKADQLDRRPRVQVEIGSPGGAKTQATAMIATGAEASFIRADVARTLGLQLRTERKWRIRGDGDATRIDVAVAALGLTDGTTVTEEIELGCVDDLAAGCDLVIGRDGLATLTFRYNGATGEASLETS